ncbi:MAG: hypothetical protein ACP5XB_18455 [Isosphaeraceae bacterium]
MGTRILARREAIGRNTVFGLLDGDFVEEFAPPRDRPRDWRTSDGTITFGWRWERKEIENYLLDPAVALPALNQRGTPSGESDYQSALEYARDQIAIYQAARTALATSRVRFTDLPSSFGRKHAGGSYLFPDALDQEGCREGLAATVNSHGQSQSIKLEDVEQKFSALIPECLVHGVRHAAFLHAFAGKDLLFMMDAKLREYGFPSGRVFLERVLVGMEQTPDDVSGWVPEWRLLQELVDTV